MPEWYALTGVAAGLALWMPWLIGLVLLALLLTGVAAGLAAWTTPLPEGLSYQNRLQRRGLIAFLHLSQPLARTWGRLRGGLGPFRFAPRRQSFAWLSAWSWGYLRAGLAAITSASTAFWSETGHEMDTVLRRLMTNLHQQRLNVSTGSGWDPWDLTVQGASGERVFVLGSIEYHGGPRRLLRLRTAARLARWTLLVELLLVLAAAGAWRSVLASAGAWPTMDTMLADGLADGALVGLQASAAPALLLALPLIWPLWLAVRRVHLAAQVQRALDQTARDLDLVRLSPQTDRPSSAARPPR
jgi:hypothetical protein